MLQVPAMSRKILEGAVSPSLCGNFDVNQVAFLAVGGAFDICAGGSQLRTLSP